MNEDLQFGQTSETKNYHEGKVTSVIKILTRKVEVKDKYDAQGKLLEFYGLIESGKTKELTLKLVADDNFVPKRLEITMVTEKKHYKLGDKK